MPRDQEIYLITTVREQRRINCSVKSPETGIPNDSVKPKYDKVKVEEEEEGKAKGYSD